MKLKKKVETIMQDIMFNVSPHARKQFFEIQDLLEELLERNEYSGEKMVVDPMTNSQKLVCPSCHGTIANAWSKIEYKPNFCHYCGKRLAEEKPFDFTGNSYNFWESTPSEKSTKDNPINPLKRFVTTEKTRMMEEDPNITEEEMQELLQHSLNIKEGGE